MIFDSRTRFWQSAESANQRDSHQQPADEPESDLEKTLKPIDQWIGRHPAICVGIALAAGVTLGCFVKQR